MFVHIIDTLILVAGRYFGIGQNLPCANWGRPSEQCRAKNYSESDQLLRLLRFLFQPRRQSLLLHDLPHIGWVSMLPCGPYMA